MSQLTYKRKEVTFTYEGNGYGGARFIEKWTEKVWAVYSGDRRLGYIKKDEDLHEWFFYFNPNTDYFCGGFTLAEVKENLERLYDRLLQEWGEHYVDELISRYMRAKDNLLDHTQELHDGMYYDIQGYCEELPEDVDLECLEKQVKTAEKLLECYRNLEYTYC